MHKCTRNDSYLCTNMKYVSKAHRDVELQYHYIDIRYNRVMFLIYNVSSLELMGPFS